MTESLELQFLRNVLTSPMDPREICEAFSYDRKYFRQLIESLPGAVQIGRRWRIPILAMPAQWLFDAGFMDVGKLRQIVFDANQLPAEPMESATTDAGETL